MPKKYPFCFAAYTIDGVYLIQERKNQTVAALSEPPDLGFKPRTATVARPYRESQGLAFQRVADW